MACFVIFGLGCSPALNWREVRSDSGTALVLMPCKPDQARRSVMLNAQGHAIQAQLQLQGCEADHMQFTWGQLSVPPGMTPAEALAAWRVASLAPLDVVAAQTPTQTWHLAGATPTPQPVRTRIQTAQHRAQWAWFVQGDTVYQAAVYGQAQAAKLDEVAEVYFSGIQLP